MLKHNNAKNHFSYKNDTPTLVELGQFLRDTTPYRVEREWYVMFGKESGNYIGFSKTFNGNPFYKPRNPDLILIDKKTNQLILVIEVDGEIHRVKEMDTEERNEDYANANIKMLIVNTWELKHTSIYDYVTQKLSEILK